MISIPNISDLPNISDPTTFPDMPKSTGKISSCSTCKALDFKGLEIAHSDDQCMRCTKCRAWRTCGQKKHDKVCSGKQIQKINIEKINIEDGEVDGESEDEDRDVGRSQDDPKFVEDCRHYHSQVSPVCRRGDLCDFAHFVIGKSAREVSGSKRHWIPDCKFHSSVGGCNKGDTCSFSHSGDGISAKEKSGNIECLKCKGSHHIANCEAVCGECGSDKHISANCIECFNCNQMGHHIKACEGPCGYCKIHGHKQPQCNFKKEDASFCDSCKVKGHSIRSHCMNCNDRAHKSIDCPHMVRGPVKFRGPNK